MLNDAHRTWSTRPAWVSLCGRGSLSSPFPRWFTLSVVASPYRSPAGAAQVRNWCSTGLAKWETPHAIHEIDTSCGQTHVVSVGTGNRVCVYLPGTNFNA